MIPKHEGPYNIPEISDAQLDERAAMVRVVVERKAYDSPEGQPNVIRERSLGLWWVEMPSDLRGIAFTWSPKWLRPVDPGELTPVRKVLTLHTYGYYGMFKPSIAEVLAAAPDDLHTYKAFSIAGPEDADDLNFNGAALHAGYHVAEVTYYR